MNFRTTPKLPLLAALIALFVLPQLASAAVAPTKTTTTTTTTKTTATVPTTVVPGSIKWIRSTQLENPKKFGALDAVSCPLLANKTGELCVVADEKGNVWITKFPFKSKKFWHRETIDKVKNASLTGVSCPTAGFCIAVDNHGDVTWTHHPGSGAKYWSRPVQVDTTAADGSTATSDGYAGFAGISCPTAALCVAVDNAGQVVTSTSPTGGASAWTVTALPKTPVLNGVSCPTTTFCLVGGSQRFYSTNPTGGASAWTGSGTLGPAGNVISSVACESATLCVAVGYGNSTLGLAAASSTPSGAASSWVNDSVYNQVPSGNVQPLDAVGCPTAGLCVALDGADNAYQSSTPLTGGWTAIKGPRKNSVSTWSSIGCDPKICVAVDSRGWVSTGAVK